jgi:alpha-tubulin suppressor-like RCC1 family protein
MSNGTIRCWGTNPVTDAPLDPAVLVPGISGAVALTSGPQHLCALLAGGSVKCWGENTHGQLGDGSNLSSAQPVQVAGLSSATAVAAGYNHTCALVGGSAKCWGGNIGGQLGTGTITPSAVPVDVVGLTGAAVLTAGGFHSCAIVTGGEVSCWGYNGQGQLGDGTTTFAPTPTMVVGLSGKTRVVAGAEHTCALGGGTVHCWGHNRSGQLGDGSTIVTGVPSRSTTPVAVVGLTGASRLSAGWNHTCALLAAGGVRCWGSNTNYELGNGTDPGDGFFESSVPVSVTGITAANGIGGNGGAHTCVTTGTAVQCWGANTGRQLGDGTTAVRLTPVSVVGMP